MNKTGEISPEKQTDKGEFTMVNSDSLMKPIQELVSSFPVRALQLYAPTEETIDDFERFVDEIVAPAGITHLTISIYFKFEYRRHPEIVEKPFTSVAVAKRVAAVCRRNGITVVPEMDIPGHQSTHILQGARPLGMIRAYPDMAEPYGEGNSSRSVCTRHPYLRPIVYDMIDELMDAFETDIIHMGFDEALDIGKCPRCKGVPEYRLLAELITDVDHHIRARGGEMWMWGDRLLDGNKFPTANVGYETSLNNTWQAVDLIPKDIVITDWHYNYEPMGHLYSSFWAMTGFRFIPSAFNSIRGSEQLVRAAYVLQDRCPNLLGTYLTTWSSLSDFMKLTEQKLPEYRKTGKIEQDPAMETSDGENAGNFADQSSNIFLKMFIRPDDK